ncbi:MAG: DUF5686 and carboxypeptidase regulatory-like domain-containing protein [Bacteroidales bacterium]|nr:DUF5686 and carboxypeptidase regulatory-like domain-containing protein [Bacteroidales bacterium]
MRLRPFIKAIATLLLLLAGVAAASAQTTKVRGRVTDESGQGIPFVAVYFDGTTVGITTDLDGYYNLENRNLSDKVLTAQLLGYDSQSRTVRPGAFSTVNFCLRLSDNRLAGAHVKADNKKARRLLANINAARSRNNPELHEKYKVRFYNKMELDLTHPETQLQGAVLRKKFDFVFDYIDTSAVSGVPYLPVMISETVAVKEHTNNPSATSEHIEANRISGVNPDMNLLSQFTGSMHLKVNFYNDFINAFDVQFPSPIMPSALLYYNYYIIDSLMVDGRKTLVVRYHPKPLVSTPAFDGEMRIDAEDFALQSIKATMKNEVNVNWLRDFVVEANYRRMPDSTWFYKSDGFYADFSMTMRDSSKVLSFIGRRSLTYDEPEFDFVPTVRRSDGPVKVAQDAGHMDEAYWQSVRPSPLTEKEQDVYKMVDEVKSLPIYRNLYTLTYTLVNGYWDIGAVGVGPFYQLISYSDLEGWRPYIGLRTSKDWSKKDRFTVFGAYGTHDRQFKGGFKWEHLVSREPWIKLEARAKYDIFQIGAGDNAIVEGNMFASMFGGSHGTRPCYMSEFRGSIAREVNPSFEYRAMARFRRFYATGDRYVPMIAPDGSLIPSVAVNELRLTARFTKDETVNKGYFMKHSLHSKWPMVELSLSGSIPGLRKGDVGYLQPELALHWKLRTPPFGMSDIWADAGTIIGQVPYPMLHVHEGNSTRLLNKQSFSCLDFFEFASDTWATLFWYHSLGGYLFGKIPLVRELKLREEFSFRATWGQLSERNDGNPTHFGGVASAVKAPMLFPLVYPGDASKAGIYMGSLGKTPYMEAGVGISNILSFLRVDCFWRLTYRDDPTRNFAWNIGAEFRF